MNAAKGEIRMDEQDLLVKIEQLRFSRRTLMNLIEIQDRELKMLRRKKTKKVSPDNPFQLIVNNTTRQLAYNEERKRSCYVFSYEEAYKEEL
jgi:hypothetical protein